MASIKPVLRSKSNQEGKYPIAIRVTVNRKSSFIYLDQYIDKKYWNSNSKSIRKSHPNSARLNNLLAKKVAEANDSLLELQKGGKQVSAIEVADKIKNRTRGKDFFQLANEYTKGLWSMGKVSRVKSEESRIKHLKEFRKSDYLPFTEITPSFLKRFMIHLKEKRDNSDRSIANCLVVIRTIYNRAIREGLIDREHYPFGKGKVVIRFPKSLKVGLSVNEIKKLEALELDHKGKRHALNVYLASLYLAGARITDMLLLKWIDIQDGRIHYQMNKNAKPVSLKIPKKAMDIFNQYKQPKQDKNDFIFPEMRKADLDLPEDIRRKVNTATKKINRYLGLICKTVGIDKKLTTHIARHSFGRLSADKIPLQMLQLLYKHSDLTTTIQYQQNFMFKDTDEALEKVLNF